MKRILFAASLLCACIPAFAQIDKQWNDEPRAIRQAAAEVKVDEFAPVTILHNERILSFDAAGRLTDTFRSTYRIERADELGGWANTGTRYEPWHQAKPKLTARVIAPDGSIADLDQKTLTDGPAGDEDEDVFSDARRVDAPLPSLVKGAIVQEEIIVTDTEPRFAAGTVERVWFSRNVPVERTTLRLIHPVSLPVKYAAYLLPQMKVEKSTAGNVETIIVENGRLEPDTSDTEYAPSGEPIYPQIAIATGASWNAIAAAYATATEPKIRPADVASLVTDTDRKLPRDERIARLVQRLHKEVRYTGVEFGESSLVPQPPAETMKRHFGDCKDKATLLVSMLRAANIPAKLVLLNAEAIQAHPDLPGMAFDHAIVYVPAGDGGKEYWIDATSQYSALGVLPHADYGRMALIVDSATSTLTKMPELRSVDNRHTEVRRFDLAEDGPAHVVEINRDYGPRDAWARSNATARNKETRERYQKYVRETYLSDHLGKLEFGDPADMNKPFTITVEALKAPRGGTDFETAVVAILPFAITDDLPNTLRYEQDKEQKAKARNVDYHFYPSVTEWRYEIQPPMGYKVGSLPPNVDRAIASAHLTETFEKAADGAVIATLRFDSGKGRLTPAEGAQLRTALAELRNASAIMIGFDSEPLALINAGKVKEGLSLYEKLSAAHPKEGLHKIQLASALSTLGLGERARAVAKQALLLDPQSSKAHAVYAHILERDLIGRRFGRGFDYAGAVAEYRKAKELDSDDKPLRVNLAILLEHSPRGLQYGVGCKLDEALKEWAELRKLDEDYAGKYENNVLFDLWHLDRLDELQERLATLETNDGRRQLLIASLALKSGPEAAIERAKSLIQDRDGRGSLLVNAGITVLRRQKYAEAAALYRAAAAETDSPAPILAAVQMFERTKPLAERTDFPNPAVAAFFRMAAESVRDDVTVADLSKMYSARVRAILSPKELEQEIKKGIEGGSAAAAKSGMSIQLIMDIAYAGAKFSTDGDDQVGYKITTTIPNTSSSYDFFVKEDGQWRYVGDQKTADHLGAIVVDALDKGDLATARRWLDWARDLITAGGDLDDPLSGHLFARFWTKGQQGDERVVRRAAVALLSRTEYAKKIADNVGTLIGEPTEAEKAKFMLLRARVAATAHRWEEERRLGGELLALYPESKTAAGIVVEASLQLKDVDRAESVLKAFYDRDPKDRGILRQIATAKTFRGDFEAAQNTLLPVIEDGSAGESDLNEYAWYSLFTKAGVDKKAIEAGERGVQLSKNNSFPIMHTLASQYAEVGRGKEAYNLILKAMESSSMVEPTSSVWYTLGRIAESYGENDAALAMYKKVEKNEDGLMFPTENFVLAQRHSEIINASVKPSAKSSAQISAR